MSNNRALSWGLGLDGGVLGLGPGFCGERVAHRGRYRCTILTPLVATTIAVIPGIPLALVVPRILPLVRVLTFGTLMFAGVRRHGGRCGLGWR